MKKESNGKRGRIHEKGNGNSNNNSGGGDWKKKFRKAIKTADGLSHIM